MKLFDGEWFGFYDKVGKKIHEGDTVIPLWGNDESRKVIYCEQMAQFLLVDRFHSAMDFDHFRSEDWMIIGEGDD